MKQSYKVGDIRNGHPVIPKEHRKTILVLADDMRLASGIATMTHEFIMGLVHKFNFIQLGATTGTSELGRVLDLSKSVEDKTGVPDASVILIPYNSYGDQRIIRELMMSYDLDAILHFTDPRFWLWLYDMEHEIRQKVPILFYAIWDNVGTSKDGFGMDPKFNAPYYGSCDGIFCISRQTYGMVNRVIGETYGDEFNIKN